MGDVMVASYSFYTFKDFRMQMSLQQCPLLHKYELFWTVKHDKLLQGGTVESQVLIPFCQVRGNERTQT